MSMSEEQTGSVFRVLPHMHILNECMYTQRHKHTQIDKHIQKHLHTETPTHGETESFLSSDMFFTFFNELMNDHWNIDRILSWMALSNDLLKP